MNDDRDRELQQLRARVAHLESLVEQLAGTRGDGRVATQPRDATVDRRRMLRHGLGLSAAAVAGVGILDAVGSSAAAVDGDSVTVGQTVSPTSTTSAPTRIVATGSDVHADAVFRVDSYAGGATSLDPDTSAAIVASYLGMETPDSGQDGAAILALTDSHTGIRAEATSGWAVHATAGSGAAAVFESYSGGAMGVYAATTAIEARSNSGTTITATSQDDVGVTGSGVAGVAGSGHKNQAGAGGWGVAGSGPTGVFGYGDEIGVDATCNTGIAVQATSTSGSAVEATSTSGIGILGTSDQAHGVKGVSRLGVGVHGVSATGPAVLAEGQTVGLEASADGIAVHAGTFTGTAVKASSSGTGVGVDAVSNGGVGVRAVSNGGVGATFQGSSAAIRLVPTATAGHPTSGQHSRGEVVLDHHGSLWVCTKGGTPGTWKRLAFA